MPPAKITNKTTKNQEISDENTGLFPIRTVSTITGVNSITLRAWERRYGLIKPVRTPKGHRLYTQNDIDLIQQVVTLLEKGISIGQVKTYLNHKETGVLSADKEDPWAVYQRRILNAVVRFDTAALDNSYNEVLSLYPIELMTAKLILPLLKSLGQRWASREGSIAEEHFFGAYLRNKLGARFHHQGMNTRGQKLLTACLPNEHHEVGLMLFCLSAINHGFRLVYLGSDIPMEELISPAHQAHCDAIVLSGSLTPETGEFKQDLSNLVDQLTIPVFIGGPVSIAAHDDILAAGATPLGTDISKAIHQIEQHFLHAS